MPRDPREVMRALATRAGAIPLPAPGLLRPLRAALAAHRGLAAAGLALALLLGLPADLLSPAFPALAVLAWAALAAAAGVAVLALRGGAAAWTRPAAALVLPLALGLAGLGLLQRATDGPRGLLGATTDLGAALQDLLFPPPEGTAADLATLRAALADPAAAPRPRPASADEALFNALLLRARDEPLRSAQALAESLRRGAEPRPDAALLHEGLLATGLPAVREVLASPPATLDPAARAHLEAVALADPAARAAALAAALPRHPPESGWGPAGAAALVRALLEASLPQGPTVATAARIAALLDGLSDPVRTAAFRDRLLDRGAADRLAEEMRALDWTREVAARRLTVAALAPPPGFPDLPMLIRVTPPEPASAVQWLRGHDEQGELWAEVPQRHDDREAARDPVPTLRVPRPWRPGEMRFRHLDRDGVPSEPVAWAFDPARALREAAQRQLQRAGVFALYQPGRVAGGRLNALPIAGPLRPGLQAVEWFTDADARPRRQEVGVSDEAVMAPALGRALVEFEVGREARTLVLVPVFHDGSRGAATELAIR